MTRFFIIIILYSNFVFSYSLDDLKFDLKEKLSGFLSQDLIIKIFGENAEDEIRLPKIPRIENSPTDKSVYTKKKILNKKTEFANLSIEKKMKFNYFFLKEIYLETLNRKVTKDDLEVYLNRFRQGATREGIYRSLVSGTEYSNLENNPSIPTKELVSFANDYSINFLGMKFSKELLMNSNKDLIKRKLVEKSLQVINHFYDNPDKLYSWYAVFSKKLANKTSWKNKIRSSSNSKAHFLWAKNSPVDHVVSEVIIKLSKVINSL